MPLAPSLRRAAREADVAVAATRGDNRKPVCLLLLPRPLEQFILRDQADDLLRAPGVLAVDPPRLRYGALGRLPATMAGWIGATQGRRLVRSVHRHGGRVAAVTIFHPLQYPVALGVLGHEPDAELWYGRWDRYEHAYDAGPALRARITQLHELAAERSALTFVCSTELARLETEAGREVELVPLSADAFPAPDPGAAVVAVSLGHLGWRTDWALLRAVAERMPELVLLLIGAWHDDEARDDPDYAVCRAAPNLVWLGARSDDEAARLILCADVGIVPFKVEPFNDAGLPYRILKYARLGRRTVTPPLAGVATWQNAVTVAPDADAFVAALRASAGARTHPDAALREWALAQTAQAQNAPLWGRLRALGVQTSG
jgi:hypothetical protein